jgi:hypothetical protein
MNLIVLLFFVALITELFSVLRSRAHRAKPVASPAPAPPEVASLAAGPAKAAPSPQLPGQQTPDPQLTMRKLKDAYLELSAGEVTASAPSKYTPEELRALIDTTAETLAKLGAHPSDVAQYLKDGLLTESLARILFEPQFREEYKKAQLLLDEQEIQKQLTKSKN